MQIDCQKWENLHNDLWRVISEHSAHQRFSDMFFIDQNTRIGFVRMWDSFLSDSSCKDDPEQILKMAFRLEKLTFGTAGYYVIKILGAWQNAIGLLLSARRQRLFGSRPAFCSIKAHRRRHYRLLSVSPGPLPFPQPARPNRPAFNVLGKHTQKKTMVRAERGNLSSFRA